MSDDDRARWERRHAAAGEPSPAPPALFESVQRLFLTTGRALEIACGRGQTAVWLALRGMEVHAVDISPVAIELARRLAEEHEVAHRIRFEVWDLDDGLPAGPSVDLLVCHMFREPRLYPAIVERIVPGGALAVAGLSEIGGEPGSFRAGRGELRQAFSALRVVAEGEGNGVTWFFGRKAA